MLECTIFKPIMINENEANVANDSGANNKENSKTATKSPIALREEVTLKMWREGGIFEKSLNRPGRPTFVFYDGPPFATGSPHYGHILSSMIKDTIPRFKTMQGYNVPRRWGWDCHGLPIENMVEKEIGLKSKKDIEEYGLQRFNEVAREFVLRYTDIWREQIPRFGRFVDMDHDYRTMDTPYTESVWWAFKTLHNKGLIYEGFKSMHLCPRCGTTLSNFEVNQGYKDITDISVYVLFRLLDKSSASDTAILAWTTTPWTLPGNAALAVGADITYVEVEVSLPVSPPSNPVVTSPATPDRAAPIKKIIVAKDRLGAVPGLTAPKILREFKGSDLVGKSYVPVFDYYAQDKTLANRDNGWKVYVADFVTTTDGTGIVHIAPAFGSDDYELSLTNKLPFIQHVGIDGKFKAEVLDFAGQLVKPKADEDGTKDANQKADIEIIKYLARKGGLYAKEKITHSYPHCWRCDTPLLNYASSSWFVKVTDIKDKLVAENRKINWVPHEVGQYRFGNWLAGARDWAISRSRYWGAPIPVWRTIGVKDSDREIKIISTRAELRAALKPRNRYIIVRHGQAENNLRLIMSSSLSAKHDLTAKGREQVMQTAAKLKSEGIDIIIASPFLRTEETAKMIANELGLQYITDPRIGELQAGIYDGKSTSEYRETFADHHDRFTWAPDKAETYMDVRRRMMAFIYDIDSKYEGKTILIITHDTPGWLLVSGSLGLNNSESLALRGKTNFFLQNAEIKRFDFVPLPHNDKYEFDAHRPYIDKVTLTDSKGRPMQRVPDVFDCWFESGSMPFAEQNYTGVASENFNPKPGLFNGLFGRLFGGIGGTGGAKNSGYPADFISEGLDQTRGWFYSMLVLGVALFDRAPYRNVIVNGLVLAEDGKKMSKRLKNYPDPMDVVNKYGIDAVRFFMLSSSVVASEDLCFSEKGVDEVVKKVINKIDNVISFYKMYAEVAENSVAIKSDSVTSPNPTNVLDRWILLRLAETTKLVTDNLEKYTLNSAARPIGEFIDDLSVWYIRRSRDRFKSADLSDKNSALATTRFVLEILSKIMAPFMPFLAENIYQQVCGVRMEDSDSSNEANSPESVHLAAWPERDLGLPNLVKDKNLLTDMQEVRRTVTLALEARMRSGIKVRQPLQALTITNAKIAGDAAISTLIKDEVNVKEIKFGPELALDTELTPELRDEGIFRELVRMIQDARKEAGLVVGVKIGVCITADKSLEAIANRNLAELERLTQVSKITFVDGASPDPASWKISIIR